MKHCAVALQCAGLAVFVAGCPGSAATPDGGAGVEEPGTSSTGDDTTAATGGASTSSSTSTSSVDGGPSSESTEGEEETGNDAPTGLPPWLPEPGTWGPISLNTMDDVNPCPGDNCSYSANLGFAGIITGWNGGVFARDLGPRGSLLVWGGGHNAYWGNEILRYNIEPRLWERVTEPSEVPAGEGGNTNAEFEGFAPGTFHTYHGIQYDPIHRYFIVFRTQNGFSHYYDFEAGSWNRGAATPQSSFNAASAYHSVREEFLAFQLSGSREFFTYQVSESKIAVADLSAPSMNIDSVMAIDPDRDLAAILSWRSDGEPRFVAKDIAADEDYTITNVIDDVPADAKRGSAGFEWVPSRGMFAWWSARTPNDLYWLSPPEGDWTAEAWTWIHEPMSGAAFTLAVDYNGTYGRFRWVPNLDAFVAVTDVGDPVFAYRPA